MYLQTYTHLYVYVSTYVYCPVRRPDSHAMVFFLALFGPFRMVRAAPQTAETQHFVS